MPRHAKNEPLHLVVDSTGVKVFGEGECNVRRHGSSKRQTWRNWYLGADESTGENVAAAVTTNKCADWQVLENLVEQIEGALEPVRGAGGADWRPCDEAIGKRKAKRAPAPRGNAKIWPPGNSKEEGLIGDENLECIRQLGRSKWK